MSIFWLSLLIYFYAIMIVVSAKYFIQHKCLGGVYHLLLLLLAYAIARGVV